MTVLLDKLAFLVYSGDDKSDEKVKRHCPKVRRIIATTGLVRGKSPRDKGKDYLGSVPD